MTDLAALEVRIRRLEDIEAIRTLRNAYHAYINDGRYGEIGALFTDDARVVLGYLATYEGGAAIDKGFRGMGERERFFIKQFIHSHDVTVDGDRGTGVSYLDARYGRHGLSFMVAGRYDDIYERRGGKWLFKSMIADLYYTVPLGVGWMGDERHYLRPKT